VNKKIIFRAIQFALFSLAIQHAVWAQETPTPKTDDKPAEVKSDTKKDDKPAAPKESDKKVEQIEVKAAPGGYDARREDTATKIVVTEAEINKYGDTQVADVLKRLPGITVIGSSIRMRGLGNGYTQILIDGERAPPGFTIDQLSPALIERIEIVRAATAEFSTQSIAGTINIVLKKKVSLAQREVRGSYAQGSFSKSFNPSFLVSDKSGNFSYTVSGYLYENRNNFPSANIERGFDAAGNQILFRESSGLSTATFKGGGAGPRLNWTLANGDTISWSNFININNGEGQGNFRFLQTQGTPTLSQSSFNRYDYTSNFFRSDVNIIKKLTDGAKLDIKIGVSLGKNNNNSITRSFNSANQQNLDRAQSTTSNDDGFTFTGKYSTPIIEGHSLVAGWDTGLNRRDESSTQRDRPFPNIVPAIQAFDSNEKYDARILKLAAFAQDEWNVTKQWSVYLGLRWESLITTSEGDKYASIRNRSSVLSPLMQTLYKLPNRTGEQIRLALTRTYKAPATPQLIPRRFTSIENKPTSPDFQGNPDLKPELATGIDVAIEKFWGQGASVSLAANIRRITDYNRRGLILLNGRWTSLPVNDGTANTKGLEFDAKFPIQTIYKDAPPIDFRLNMNRNWSSVDSVPSPNNRLDSQTPFSGTFGLDYRMKNGEVVAGGSYSFRSGGRVRTSPTQESIQSTKRDLDVYALWKVTKKTQLRLTLSNILKQPSNNESVYFDQFGSTRNSNTTPSKMNIRAGVEVKF
jgi:outer membrane receptor for ferrienterochelin and colicins